MNEHDTAVRLAQLRHIEQEGVRLTQVVMGMLGDQAVVAAVEQQQAAHERHARELDSLIGDLGGAPSGIPDDLQKMTGHQVGLAETARDADEAMLHLLGLQRMAAAEYASTLQLQPPEDAARTLRAHLQEEHEHVDFDRRTAPRMTASDTTATTGRTTGEVGAGPTGAGIGGTRRGADVGPTEAGIGGKRRGAVVGPTPTGYVGRPAGEHGETGTATDVPGDIGPGEVGDTARLTGSRGAGQRTEGREEQEGKRNRGSEEEE